MAYRLGVDLGTTFTAAAHVEDDQPPRMLDLGNRDVSVPSVLFVTSDGQLLFGEAAERRAAAEPEHVIREFKRRFGDAVPIVVGHRTFDPVQLQTELLRWVVHSATERLGGPPEHVVVTHPANWGPFKIQLMRDMVVAAGAPQATLCPEPVAAAIEYAAKRRVPVGARLAVYDLGGGTFDVAVLEKTETGFAVLGTPLGIEHLGGSDFDEAVFAEALSRVDVADLDLDDPVVSRALSALRRECVEAKEALSSDVSTEISSLLPDAVRTVRFTRSEFEGLIRPALVDSISTTDRALRLAGVQASELHSVVLVGGSSRIPLVSELLARELRVPVAMDTYPKNDIALGAARYADREDVRSSAASAGVASVPRAGADEERGLSFPDDQPAERTGSHPAGSAPPNPPTTPSNASVGAPVAGGIEAAGPVPPGPVPPGPAPEWMTEATNEADQPVDERSQLSGPDDDSSTRRRRTLIALVVGVVVIALGVGTGFAINRFRASTAVGGQPTATETSEASLEPSPEPTPSPDPTPSIPDPVEYGLPVGEPLSADQLLVPIINKRGDPADLWLIDTAEPSNSRDLEAESDGNSYGIGLSLDRRTMTFIDAGANVVRTMAATGGEGRVLFESPEGCGQIQHASWSPTDLSIFVLECRVDDGPKRLLVVRMDGTVERELETGYEQSGDPTISPDGSEVAFWGASTLDKGEGGSIVVMPITGGSTRVVTDGEPGVDGDPAWSPDGTSLALRRLADSGPRNYDVFVIPSGGGAATKILSGPANDEKPAWSTDGSTIVAVSTRDDDGKPGNRDGLWRIDAGGGDPVALDVQAYHVATPTWWHR